MSASSVITSQTEPALAGQYVPIVHPATATVEEMDAAACWTEIKSENPGDPDFPFASALQ
jgi:hypothetical protein